MMRKSSRRLGVVFRASWQGAGRRFPVTTLGVVSTYVAGVVTAALLRNAVNAAASRDFDQALLVLLVVAVIDAVIFVASRALSRVGNRVQEFTRQWFDREVVRLAASAPGLEHYENPEFLDRLEMIRTQPAPLAQAYIVLNNLTAISVQAVLMGVLLVSVDVRLVGLAFLAAPLVVAIVKANELETRAWKSVSPHGRLSGELFNVATAPATAPEVHALGLHELLEDRMRTGRATVRNGMRRAHAVSIALSGVASAVSALVLGFGLVVITHRAVEGTASLGDVVLAISLTGLISRQVIVATEMISRLANSTRLLDEFIWLEDYAAQFENDTCDDIPPPTSLSSGIVLRDVSFRYPHADRDAVSGIEIVLEPGEVVALIGENGAGKTTLVKLLTGMYQPTLGEISVDGIPLQDIDAGQWRVQTSAAFQDFARFELIARETVGVGHLPHIDDETFVVAALGKAGGTDVVESLSDGLATELGRSFVGGRELSGGQWQKLALGRTMMRPAPLLLVFDEPTASLDAIAEHALFSRYAAQSRALAAEVAAVTILISHRFSTVRMANRIIVLSGGRVAEQGTHDELMAANGLYAELYELQSAAYQ